MIIESEVYFYFELCVLIILHLLLSAVGVLTNIVNIIVYCKIGVKDSVTVTFIALSIWDMGNCVSTFVTVICNMIERYFPIEYVNLEAIQLMYLLLIRGLMYGMSTSITVYLSLERCISVLAPLNVKRVFTKSRAIATNMGIFIFGVACTVVSFSSENLHWGFDQNFNKTRLGLSYSENRRQTNSYGEILASIVSPIVTQAVITVNSVLMIYAVNTKLNFKHANKTTIFYCSEPDNGLRKKNTRDTKAVKSNGITQKDVRMTKVVIWIDVIYFICNFPLPIHGLAKTIIPELEVGGDLRDLYQTFYTIILLFGVINSNASFAIYYCASTKYKQVFVSLFRNRKIADMKNFK